MKKIITGVIVIFWMLTIGSFSAQQGEQSAGMSGKVATAIVKIENAVFYKNGMGEAQMGQRVRELQYPVRKIAHMIEYAILTILLVWHISSYGKTFRFCLLLAWLIATVYAASDEIHQLFVPGRAGQIKDVGFDSLGAICGILLIFICKLLFFNKKQK